MSGRSAALVVGLLALAAGVNAATAGGAGDRREPTRRSVLLVPVAPFPQADATALARAYRARWGVRVEVRPLRSLPAAAVNPASRRVIGERLAGRLRARHRAPSAVVVGLVHRDMEIGPRGARRLAFSFRDDTRRVAVVSTARLDPSFFGFREDDSLLFRRTSKLVTRNYAFLRLGSSPSDDPRSVVYRRAPVNLDQLDYATDLLRPRETASARRWRREANEACGSAMRAGRKAARSQLRARSDFLRLARTTLTIERRLSSRLRGLARRAGAPRTARRLAGLVEAAAAHDARDIATLERAWSEKAFAGWVHRSEQTNRTMRALSLELGLRRCGLYWNPLAYRR